MTINASDLQLALSTYKDWVRLTETRNSLTIDNAATVDVIFRDNTPEHSKLYSGTLTGSDLTDIAKVIRRQLLVDINNLQIQLDALGVVVDITP